MNNNNNNNLDVDENVGLIDISLEDDFLIDKRFDNSSVDLRLSVAFETQMELVRDLKPRGRVVENDRLQYLADKEVETYRLKRENDNNVRNSLAWDSAFFTSPGLLELEELSLVNRGFKDPQRQSVSGDLEDVRRKVCLERNSGLRAGVAPGRRQNTHSLSRAKLKSPTKMMAMQDSIHPLMATRRSEAFPGAPSKSQVTQSITSRKEYLKSGKATDQNRFSTAHNKKSPLQGLSKNGKNRTPERSVVTKDTNDYAARTVNLTTSQEIKGECSSGFHSPINVYSRNTDVEQPSPQATHCLAYTSASYTSNFGDHGNNQKLCQSCVKQVNSGRELQRQNATRATKSPVSASSKFSPKPSSLRMPSEKFDYFDTKSEVPTVDESSLPSPNAHINCNAKPVTNEATYVLTPPNEPKQRLNTTKPKGTPPILLERKADARINKAGKYKECHHIIMRRTNPLGKDEKENMFLSDDTVIELQPKQRSPLPLQFGANGSTVTSKPSANSSRKRAVAVKRPKPQTNLSPLGTGKSFLTRISPLKRSAFF